MALRHYPGILPMLKEKRIIILQGGGENRGSGLSMRVQSLNSGLVVGGYCWDKEKKTETVCTRKYSTKNQLLGKHQAKSNLKITIKNRQNLKP